MSTLTPGTVLCHRCGGRFPAQLWTGLHATTARGVRDEVLADTFHRFDCPHCGDSVRVEPTMLYTDFERHHWIAVLPDEAIRHRSELVRLVDEGFHRNMEVHCPPMVKQWAPLFLRRVVFGLQSLRDKLIAFDAGLDDRVLELFKLQLLRGAGPVRQDTRLWLDAVEAERLVFCRIEREEGVGMDLVRRFAVPRVAYEALVDRPTPHLEGAVVDWRAPMQPDLPLAKAS